MLKLLPPNAFITPNAKCAEIYCQGPTEFTILCVFCKMKIFEFDDFLIHFKNLHIENNLLKIAEVEIDPAPCVEIKIVQQEELYEDSDSADEEGVQGEEKIVLEEPLPDEIEENASQSNHDQEDLDSDEYYEPEKRRSNKKSLQRERTHHCPECRKSYVGAPHLQAHMKKEHDPKELPDSDKILACEQCEQKFSDQRRLDVHLIHIHGGIPCDKCSKKFKFRYMLNRHYPRHSGVKSFKCDFENCKKTYFTRKGLSTHKITHRKTKAYVCDHCGYSCHESATLRLHVRCHTGERPFPCPICQKCFRSKALLNDHKPMHSKERPHVCDVCGASFAHRKTLYHHKPLHSDVKKFVCKICGTAFAQAAGLAGHMRKHKEGLL